MASEHVVKIEDGLKNMNHVEQFVQNVVSFTSRYNNIYSSSYSPCNLVGKYVKYPSYGDFFEAYILRTYGKWWKKSAAYQQEYKPQDVDPLGAEDYVTLEFEHAVVPRDICIYEIYNPGAIVRIWGLQENGPWVKLWEGPPQVCPETSRKFHPTIKIINELIRIVRLEFNQSGLKYHTSIDAVLLGGYQPRTNLQYLMLSVGCCVAVKLEEPEIDTLKDCDTTCDTVDVFQLLPNEILLHIFKFLDLKSLCRAAQVSRRWRERADDPVLFQNISLKRYWNLVNCEALEYFIDKCDMLKKLDLSWCNADDSETFTNLVIALLEENATTLTHLSMCDCYTSSSVLHSVAKCSKLTDLRLRNTITRLPAFGSLNKLVSLDLSLTNITDWDLQEILRTNSGLEHIVIDLCEQLRMLDDTIEVATTYNRRLSVWSSWETPSLTSEGVRHFSKFPELRELDLGWCLMNTHPEDGLEHIASGCPKLQRLIISEWRGLDDHLLMPIIENCKELTQLDLLGIKNISADLCNAALVGLPRLRRLEISFCDSIPHEEVNVWREMYPHITIQRSCQYVVNDYLN